MAFAQPTNTGADGGEPPTSAAPESESPPVAPAAAADSTTATVPGPKVAALPAPTPVPDPSQQVIALTNAPPPLVWRWARFRAADYLITAAGGATTLAMAIAKPRPQHSLQGGLWFDEDVRDALRGNTLANRYIFRDASDVGLSLMVTWPLVADALTAAWWYRGSREAAEQMALIDLEAFAISGALQGVTNTLVSRERPFGRNCGSPELPDSSIDCANSVHYRSFFSGHSSFAFTGAALICAHHFKTELLGSPWDGISCAGGYAVAATTATFRVVADVHYATDILTGALLGTAVGYAVPLWHYSRAGLTSTTMTGGVQLHLVPSPGGLGVMGIF